jgi:serine/threonine protein kinase
MIAPGTKLGTYKVTSLIGSGGMGEVYQAHDSKRGRDVAIRIQSARSASKRGGPRSEQPKILKTAS